MIVTALKEGIEDYSRSKNDRSVNSAKGLTTYNLNSYVMYVLLIAV